MYSLKSLLITTAALLALPSSASEDKDPWTTKYAIDTDLSFTGISSFAHLPHVRCLDQTSQALDIAVLGVPFDNAVSFRPGARFGPFGIRSGSRRQTSYRGYGIPLSHNPYQSGFEIIDCGDVPASPFDKHLALDQIEAAYTSLLNRPVKTPSTFEDRFNAQNSPDWHPRIVSLGGDHTIVLPILRSLNKVYGPVSVIHFDAHLDTWSPLAYPGRVNDAPDVNHGTFFWKAYQEGLIRPNSSIHAGIRTRLTSTVDLDDDRTAGFDIVYTSDIDEPDVGLQGIVDRIKNRIGNNPVVLSFDIDVIDPSMAPATGTPETGGWTTREVRRLIQNLRGLNIVGMDLVEVSPAYDTNAELTNIAAADIVYEFLSILTLGRNNDGTTLKTQHLKEEL